MLQLTVIQVYKINDYFYGFVPTRDKIDQSLEVQIVGYSDIKSQGHPNLKWDIVSHGFPAGSNGKESACNAGDPDLIPELGKSPGEKNGNPLQYSCVKNSMDRGAWQATVHRVAKSWT